MTFSYTSPLQRWILESQRELLERSQAHRPALRSRINAAFLREI